MKDFSAWRRSRLIGLISLIIVAGLVSACAEDPGPEEDRRFANEPNEAPTTVATKATPTDSTRNAPTPTVPSVASPESLLNVRGAPDVIYTAGNSAIVIVDTVDSGKRLSIQVEPDRRVLDLASAPDGRQVAVLTAQADRTADPEIEVVVYDDHGQVTHQWSGFDGDGSPGGTPVAGSEPGGTPPGFITWAADGNRLLLSTGDRELVTIEIGGDVSRLPLPSRITRAEDAAWSPEGDTIAVLARDDQGGGEIWLIEPFAEGEGVPARQVVPPDADASNLGSVASFSWLPDGSGFAYILSAEVDATNPGGQLYSLNLKTGIKLLVATPGRGGPAAQIVDFVVSPDGRSIAYVIAIPAGEQWEFHSLWVRGLQTPNAYNVPVANPDRINRMWWTARGLAWEEQAGDEAAILLQSESTDTKRLLVWGPDDGATPMPLATPVASPVIATPGAATAVASPVIATPEAATPIDDTPNGGTPQG